MSAPEIVAFVPCRAGSQRVPRKNTRAFAGRDGGLLCLKLAQLAAVRALTEVIVDSNDEEVLELAERARRTWPSESKLTVRRRPDVLGSASTTTDELIAYALETIAAETLLWTHVTSPMVDASVYERACETFRARSDECDSLMSVHRLQTFLWNEHGPVNYDPAMLRWPRTQDLPPLFAVDSAIFLVPMAVARARGDRIGARPALFELTSTEAIDVDWQQDFDLAERVYAAVHGEV